MKRNIIILFAILFAFCSCNGNGKNDNIPNVSNETVIGGLDSGHWTYFSFEKGDVVGTSKFDDDAEDAEWASRNDWDFAICGDYIKTNGGSSGKGYGGIQRDSTNSFSTLTEAPKNGYVQDIVQMIR